MEAPGWKEPSITYGEGRGIITNPENEAFQGKAEWCSSWSSDGETVSVVKQYYMKQNHLEDEWTQSEMMGEHQHLRDQVSQRWLRNGEFGEQIIPFNHLLQ